MGLYQLTILNRNAVKLQDRRLQYDRSNPLHSRDVWGMRNTAGKMTALRTSIRTEFREVDIQTDLETSEEYGVRKTPTTLVYANGKQTAEFIGIVERNDLESAIERATEQSSGLAQRLVDVVRK